MVLSPADSGAHIVKNAKYLHVLPEGIEKLAKEILAGLQEGSINPFNFMQDGIHPRHTDAFAVEWLFLVDALNFCFWTMTDYTKYKVNGQTGYFALCAAINRAMSEGIDITNAAYYATIDAATLRHIFRSDDGETEVPLFEKRLAVMHEVGQQLLNKWEGKFENVLRAANNSAVRLLELIVSEFPCFRDEADFAGERVALYKRAQILIGDLWTCFRGEGLGAFDNLQYITMFADYRVPQVLVHFGCLEYSDVLLETLRQDAIMKNGDAMEVEIRGASIYVVEEIKAALMRAVEQQKLDIDRAKINSIMIDNFLWDYRRQHAEELAHIPFHKVLSVYY